MPALRKLALTAAALTVAATGTVLVAAPAAEAATAPPKYVNCRAWWTPNGVGGDCERIEGTYRIEVLCQKWWSSTQTGAYGVRKYAPGDSVATCPYGYKPVGGILYSYHFGNVAWIY